MAERYTILLVEDDPATRKLLRLCLASEGFLVETADNGEAGWTTFQETNPDLVLTDVGLPGLDGVELTRRIKRRRPVPVFLMSGREEPALHQADLFFMKPMPVEDLMDAIWDACRLYEREEVPDELRRS